MFVKLMFNLIVLISLSNEVEKICGNYKTEVLLIYDVTRSFSQDLKKLREISLTLFDEVEKNFPESKFGFASFADKSLQDLGLTGDQCFHLNQPLTKDRHHISSVIKKVSLFNGGDTLESQLDSLYHSLHSETIGWSKDNENILRVVIMATDSDYHKAGDGLQYNHDLKQHDGRAYPACDILDYSTVDLISRKAIEADINFAFFVRDEEDVLIKTYNNLLDEIGTNGVVLALNEDSSNIIDLIKEALMQISCANPPPPPPIGFIPPVPEEEEGSKTGIIAGAAAGAVAVGALAILAAGVAYNRTGGEALLGDQEDGILLDENARQIEVNREQGGMLDPSTFI